MPVEADAARYALGTPEHETFLIAETDRLFHGAAAALQGDVFAWLGEDARPDRSKGSQLWIQSRMIHLFALGQLLGRPGDGDRADAGIAGLRRVFADPQHGGWFSHVGEEGPVPGAKSAYDHVFVMLAASTALVAGRPGAAELLSDAVAVVEEHFWDDAAGALVDAASRDWSEVEPYRGGNANMHGVEAFLAVGDATGDPVWAERAARIVDRLIRVGAGTHDWRVPEHFDADWRVQTDYNRDRPRDPFRPYGVTPGHGLEWSRLCLALATTGVGGEDSLELAAGLFGRAVSDGWSDAQPGLAYTTGWDGVPVVAERFHWVLCEGIAAAAVLARVTGEQTYLDWYSRWWALADARFIDREGTGWRPELAPDGGVASGTWTGRPDWYHAIQATLIPRLPLAPSLAESVRPETSSGE